MTKDADSDDFVPGGAENPTSIPLATAQGIGNVVALTFDDGPNPGETENLLDVLKEHDIAATFCVIGHNVDAEGGQSIVKRIVAEGHRLCNHSTSYADMGNMTAQQLRADMIANLNTIRAALDADDYPVPYFRAPNGSWGAENLVARTAAELGMQPLGLGTVIFDWDDGNQDADVFEANLRAAIQPGSVVLGHDGAATATRRSRPSDVCLTTAPTHGNSPSRQLDRSARSRRQRSATTSRQPNNPGVHEVRMRIGLNYSGAASRSTVSASTDAPMVETRT